MKKSTGMTSLSTGGAIQQKIVSAFQRPKTDPQDTVFFSEILPLNNNESWESF